MRICVFYSVLVVLHFKIYHIVAFKDLSTGHTFPLKFFPLRFYCFSSEAKNNYWIFLLNFGNNNYFKRKKEKKESTLVKWRVSKKQVFLKNTTTLNRPLEVGICCLIEKSFWKRMGGGDFLKNPKGLNLLFCKPGTYLCSLFFILFFCFRSRIFLWESDFFVSESRSSCKGFKFWGWMKKPKSIKMLFIQNRNLKLLLHCLIFCGAWTWKYAVAVTVSSVLLLKMGSTSKKQCKYYRVRGQ